MGLMPVLSPAGRQPAMRFTSEADIVRGVTMSSAVGMIAMISRNGRVVCRKEMA